MPTQFLSRAAELSHELNLISERNVCVLTKTRHACCVVPETIKGNTMKQTSQPKVRLLATAVALASSPFLAMPAMAQSQPGLEEIVVTARYREESLQVSPLAVTAISSQEVDARQFTSSADIGYNIPNASFRPAQAAYGNTMTAFIRGIGQSDFDFAFEPGVGVYIDDVYHPTTMGSMMDLMDLERVEVLRGPQGTLFGRGSLGGAIRLVSKAPTGDDTGNIAITAGEFGRKDLRASYDFAITDGLYARVSAMSKYREGHQDRIDFACAYPALAGTLPSQGGNRLSNCKLGTNGGEDVTGYRGALLWEASDDLTLQFTIDQQDDKSEVRANTLLTTNVIGNYVAWDQFIYDTYGIHYDNRFVPDSPYISYATFNDPLTGTAVPPKTSLQNGGWSLKGDYIFNDDHSVTVIYAQRNFDSLFGNDHDVSPITIQQVDGIQNMDTKTLEVRFSGLLFDGRAEYTAGTFLYRGDVNSAQRVIFPGTLYTPGGAYPTTSDGVLVNGFIANEAEHDSVFAHVVYDLTDRLSLTVGGRYSEDSKYSDFDNSQVQAIVDAKDDRWDWKAGLDYQLTEEIMVYASAASGYRPQAYNPRPFQASQFKPVDGEEAVSYDLGVKGDFFDNTLRLNAALFYTDYKQRITSAGGTDCLRNNDGSLVDPVAPGTPGAVTDTFGDTCSRTTSLTRYINTPGEIDGFELEATWRPTEALTITGMFGYTGWDSPDLNNNVVTKLPANVPETNWALSGQYDFFLSNGAQLSPRLDYYGQDDICTSVTSLNSCSEGYKLLNARLTWISPDQTWRAALGMTNVTDEEYYLNRFDGTAFGQPYTQGQPGRPQEWYLTVSREF
jgi:iron complex outermembrane receptor protein